jgi:LacI family transcriptional regulator
MDYAGFSLAPSWIARKSSAVLRKVVMPREKSSETRIKRVAVLVDTSTTWGRDVIEGVHRYSRGTVGWQLFVEPRGMEQRRWLPEGWKGDGVIARVGFVDLARRLREMDLPVVNVSGISLARVNFPRVVSDQVAAAGLAAGHLIDRGFKHFAYFSVVGLEYVAAHQQAFVDALRASGNGCDVYAVQPHLGAEPDWNLDMERMGKWLESLPKPLAVFTWNSSSARELIYACLQAGLAVPEEVAVLSGSDDDLFCEVTPVRISAVQLDCEQIGYRAAAALDAMMDDPDGERPGDVLIAPKGVKDRRSTETLAVDDPAMVRALRYIRENPGRAIQVQAVARQAGLCRRTLEHRFQQLLGRSPAAEIRRLRIERAIELLQRTRLSVATVAERSGFSSAEYMASVFREQLGATPLQYRRSEPEP